MAQGVPSVGLFCRSPLVMLYQASTRLCRTITTHWQEIAMVAGIACAVIGAVAALFQSMPLLACTFLFFGAICAAGLAFMHQINAIRKLEKEILGSMQTENEKLKSSNIALEKTKTELEKTAGELKQTKGDLEESVRQLKIENAKQKSDFDESNQKLSTQVKELALLVARLSALDESFKDGLHKSIGNTEIAEKVLSKFQDHVGHVQIVLKQVEEQFKMQNQTFDQHMNGLKEFFSNTNVQNCMNQLLGLTRELAAKHQEHKQLLLEYAQHKEAFGRERTLLEEATKNLKKLHPLLQKDERGIQAGVEQLKAQNERFREELVTLTHLLTTLGRAS